jgi:predicted MPP superfamily phosphohydrolase
MTHRAPSLRSAKRGVRLLDNEAVRLGPVTIGGLDDAHTKRHDVPRTVAQVRRLGGAGLILSHSPDAFPEVPPDIGLTLAGHTHCGQSCRRSSARSPRRPATAGASLAGSFGKRAKP